MDIFDSQQILKIEALLRKQVKGFKYYVHISMSDCEYMIKKSINFLFFFISLNIWASFLIFIVILLTF